VQVKLGEREKKVVKFGINLFRKKLGKRGTVNNIHKELLSVDYLPVTKIISLINKTSSYTDHKYQSDIIRKYGELGIWIIINHPMFKGVLESLCKEGTNIKIPEEEFIYKSKLTKTELWLINKVLLYTKKKLLEPGSLYRYIREDIEATQNEACDYLLSIVSTTLEKIEDKEIRDAVTVLSHILIWCMIRDTAYRDQFFWSLWQIGNKEVRHRINLHPTKLVRPPKLWYSNLWLKGKNKSKEMRASGELKLGEFCDLESPCVPHIQHREVNKGFRR